VLLVYPSLLYRSSFAKSVVAFLRFPVPFRFARNRLICSAMICRAQAGFRPPLPSWHR